MARFNFIDAASKGYRFIWDERHILARLALVPLAVKIVCFNAAIAFDLQDNALRQGLMLLPSYFFEGWLVTHAIRMAAFGERLPQPSAGRAVSAAVAIYMLTKLICSFFSGLLLMKTGLPPVEQPEPSLSGLLMFFILFSVLIWVFRFAWLYVPVAMDIPIRVFLKKIEGFGTSFYILALWILFVIPMAVITIGFADFLRGIFPAAPDKTPHVVYLHGVATAQAFMETLIAVMGAVGMAHAIKDMFTGENKKRPLF